MTFLTSIDKRSFQSACDMTQMEKMQNMAVTSSGAVFSHWLDRRWMTARASQNTITSTIKTCFIWSVSQQGACWSLGRQHLSGDLRPSDERPMTSAGQRTKTYLDHGLFILIRRKVHLIGFVGVREFKQIWRWINDKIGNDDSWIRNHMTLAEYLQCS